MCFLLKRNPEQIKPPEIYKFESLYNNKLFNVFLVCWKSKFFLFKIIIFKGIMGFANREGCSKMLNASVPSKLFFFSFLV